MSGLARLGGDATTGLAFAGAVAGAATAYGMSRVMPDRPYLTQEERVSRRNGRCAASASAIGGVALSYHLVGAMGVAGYSAAGITSGLAALGGTVGGGMAVGVTIAVGLPAVLAALLGYLMYRLTQRWFNRATTQEAGSNGGLDCGGLAGT
jgi:hypothetical protein